MKTTKTKISIASHKRRKSVHVLDHRLPRAAGLAMLLGLPTMAQAQDKSNGLIETSSFDKLWRHATLYKDPQNPILQEFKLRGRYQGQYWNVDDSSGSQSGWEDRRSRIGFDAKLFEKKLEIRADFQSNNEFKDIYDGLVDAYLRWKPVPSVYILLGKTKPLIAHYDWLESTTSQPTFERSQIFNQLGINRATALTIEGTTAEWSWRAGIYSNDTPATTAGSGSFGDGEFGDFNGGVSFTLGGGYDFKNILGLEKADFRLDWLHSDREPDDLVLARYDDILTATFFLKQEEATVIFEAFHASGGDGRNSDVFGFFIQPSYDIIPDKLQLVGRYSYASSEGPFGVIGQGRYERTVADFGGRGDTYHSLYAGIQYFIYGEKLKVLAGTEWSRISGEEEAYDGFTFLTGLRMSF